MPTKKPPAKRPAKSKPTKAAAPSAGDQALGLGKTKLGSGTPGVITTDLSGRAMLAVGRTKYALLIRDRDQVIVSLLLPEAHRGKEIEIAALRAGPGKQPAPAPRPPDRFRAVADTLVAALVAAKGDVAKEEVALRKAIDGFVALAEDGDPDRTGVTAYLAEDGSAANPPALERVPGCTEADTFRWREKLLDLAGF